MSLRIKEYENLLQEKYFLASLPHKTSTTISLPVFLKTEEYPSKL
jgi:hypothetical protein